MAEKRKSVGIVELTKAYNRRIEEVEERLLVLGQEAEHFAKTLPGILDSIETCEVTIETCDTSIAELQARRDVLRNEYMEASFSGQDETARAITAERQGIDASIDTHKGEREKAETNLNRLKSNLETSRDAAFEALAPDYLPDTDVFLAEFTRRLREQTEALQSKQEAIEPLYDLLPGN